MAKRIIDEEMRFSIIVNGNEAQKELYDLEKATRKLNETNKDLRAEKARLIAQGKKDSDEYKRVTSEIKQNTAAIKANAAQMKVLQGQIGITGLTMGQLSSKANQLKLQLRNMVPGSPEYKRLQADLAGVSSRMDELRLKSVATKTSIGSIADGFSRYAALGASVIATGTGIVLSIQKMIDYNGLLSDAQANVRKVTGLTEEGVDDLTKKLGLFKTRTARIELLALAEEAGRLGITGVQNILDFVEVANQMKVALGDDLGDEQIREVGKMVNIYKVGEKTGRDFKNSLLSLGSAINEVSASGSNQAGFLVDYLKRQAGVSAQTKLSAADNIGYAATFDELGQSVEVSATAMNKVWVDMFSDTATYAKIAGMDVGDFTDLLNTDANQAMILFLKGLNGNNEGLSVMVDKLKDLDVGGARATQTLAAIAGNTNLLEERQTIANKALTEAISLTNEYDIKNNNLAATIEKVKKTIIGAFSSETVINGLSSLIGRLAVLVGAVDDVDEAFRKETKSTYDSAKANRKAADESSALLSEYLRLTAEGVKPTTESKQRLEEITLLLTDKLGKSVMAIDKETGALWLNTDAVKEQIRLKRLSADEEAATLVSRLKGSKDAKEELESELELAKKDFETRKRLFAQANKDRGNLEGKSPSEIAQISAAQKQAQQAFRESQAKVFQVAQAIAEQENRRLDILKKLKDLNFSEADADAFFKTTEPTPAPTTPTVTDPPPLPTIPLNDKEKDNAKKRAEDLLKLQREAEDDRLKAMQEGFDKEMLLEDFNHYRKIEDLQAKLVDESLIRSAKKSGNTNLYESYIEHNKAVNTQIESELELHQIRLGTIIQKGINNKFDLEQQKYEREKVERFTAYNNELAALGNNERAKERLREKFDKEELKKDQAHLEAIIAQFKNVLSSSDFEGFNLDLLSDSELQQLKDRLAEAGLSLSEINDMLSQIRGSKDPLDLGTGGDIDFFGFSAQQWVDTFTNLDTVEAKINAASTAVQGFMNAWAMYDNFLREKQAKELQKFERATQIKKDKQKQLLDQGFINQRQYDANMKALETEADKRKAEMEYNAAKRAWKMQLAQAMAGAAMATINGFNTVPFFPLGIIMGALAATLGTAQVAMVASNKPVKGFESGYYPVQREQDGKMFKAVFGGESRTGIVDKPTVFLAGEGGRNFPEMIIDGRSFSQMNPDVKRALYGELARVKGFEKGYVSTQTPNVSYSEPTSTNPSPTESALLAAILRNNQLLEKLEKNGIDAYFDKSFRNLKKLREELKRYDDFESKNRK